MTAIIPNKNIKGAIVKDKRQSVKIKTSPRVAYKNKFALIIRGALLLAMYIKITGGPGIPVLPPKNPPKAPVI